MRTMPLWRKKTMRIDINDKVLSHSITFLEVNEKQIKIMYERLALHFSVITYDSDWQFVIRSLRTVVSFIVLRTIH
jgi:hypothetical protein